MREMINVEKAGVRRGRRRKQLYGLRVIQVIKLPKALVLYSKVSRCTGTLKL